MHYYQFNVADYRKDTTHLSPLEHYIYRSLIDWYYLDEEPIPKKTQLVLRRLGLGSDGLQFLENVLSDFFREEENCYKHDRIEAELEKYRQKAEIARVNGIKGGRPKGSTKKPRKTYPVKNRNPEKTGLKANQEPITNNHSNKQNTKIERPADVEVQVWDDFLSHRKKQRADLTLTALNRIKSQADKAGLSLNEVLSEMVARGWRGFQAEWMEKDKKKSSGSYTDGVELWT